jgi:hypothetical protein
MGNTMTKTSLVSKVPLRAILTACAVAVCLVSLLAYSTVNARKNRRAQNIRQLTDGCLANISAAGAYPSLPCAFDPPVDRPCTTPRATGFGYAPWSSSETDVLVQSATPEELQLCTCISTRIVDDRLPSAGFYCPMFNGPKRDTFKAAIAEVAKQCGGATSDDQTTVRLQIGR